jgi:hypothetical protein
MYDFIEHTGKNFVPKSDLCLPSFHQPIGLCTALGLVKEFVFCKGLWVNHAEGYWQWIEQGCGKISFNYHLPRSAPCAEQSEAKQEEPSPYADVLKA